MSKTKRMTMPVYLTDEDNELIKLIMQFFGVTSKNEAIRMSLRAARREIERLQNDRINLQPLVDPDTGSMPMMSEEEARAIMRMVEPEE